MLETCAPDSINQREFTLGGYSLKGRTLTAIFAAALLVLGDVPLGVAQPSGTPTTITVRVIAKGGKFVSAEVGGVLITIRDAQTQELLASGNVTGTSGDTTGIMEALTTRSRGIPVDDDAAAFTVTLLLDRPRLLEVSAYGPLAQLQSATRVTATQWVVPGKDITGGDGLLLELPGLLVDVLDPPTHHLVQLGGAPRTVRIRANVMMMCGCPIAPGGPWDPVAFEVAARLVRNGESAGELPLAFTGTTSEFAAAWTINEPGVYEATVYAYQPANGNTGLDSVAFIVM